MPVALRILVAAAIGAAGCARSTSLPEPPGVSSSALTAATSCEALRETFASTGVREMRMTIEGYRSGAWGGFGGGILRTEGGGAAGPASPAPSASGPAATTGTNDQVKGVDEGDLMKNDGTHLFVLSGQRLWIAKSWPPKDLSLAASLAIEGFPTELHLDEKARAVVVSLVPDLWTPGSGGPPMGGPMPMGVAAPMVCRPDFGCLGGAATTKLTVIDVKDPAAPVVLDQHFLPGGSRASRRVGSTVRFVLTEPVRWPEGVRFWPDWRTDFQNSDAWNHALDVLEAANEKIIRAAPLASWLPPGKRKLADGSVVEVGYQCSDFYVAQAPVRLGLATVATLDLDAGGPPARTSIVGEATQVYSSASTLYLAEEHWWWWPRPGQTDFTYLHAFDLSDPGAARYLASGGVEGHPLDQFSLDEHDGALRIATTTATRVPEVDSRWGRLSLSNRVSVLARDGASLKVVGRTPEIAPGESLRSARFAGDRGYLVTFKNIDPLFALDLVDKTAPRVAGELKTPGFATYLHPIDADHLLALGIDLPEPDAQGRVDFSQRRMKLSLFDVADLAAPKLRAVQLVGTANGWSEAAYEHRAFNWFGARNLLAIPFSDQVASATDRWGTFVSDLRVFKVDAAAGTIASLGAVDLRDLFQASKPDFDGWYSPWVRRSVISTDAAGAEFVYAVSDAGVRVAQVGSLAKPVASLAFPRALR